SAMTLVVFFFQAEDGIRDFHVTGVQTCALPISHFRGRDIWFMGGDYDDYYSSGWVGRYLNQEYAPKSYPADFPNEDMKDPLAIELGSDVSLVFHQSGNIPTSISLGGDPEGFAALVNNLEGFTDQGIDPRGKPPAILDNSP